MSININSTEFEINSYNKRSRYQLVLLEEHKLNVDNMSILEHVCMRDLSLPIVEVNVGLKLSSVNLTRIEVFPTLLSPIRSNLNSTSYLLPMVDYQQIRTQISSPSKTRPIIMGAGLAVIDDPVPVIGLALKWERNK